MLQYKNSFYYFHSMRFIIRSTSTKTKNMYLKIIIIVYFKICKNKILRINKMYSNNFNTKKCTV